MHFLFLSHYIPFFPLNFAVLITPSINIYIYIIYYKFKPSCCEMFCKLLYYHLLCGSVFKVSEIYFNMAFACLLCKMVAVYDSTCCRHSFSLTTFLPGIIAVKVTHRTRYAVGRRPKCTCLLLQQWEFLSSEMCVDGPSITCLELLLEPVLQVVR